MKRIKSLSILLILVIVTGIFSGCGKSTTETKTTDAATTTETATDTATTTEPAATVETEKIVYAFPLLSNEPADLKEVQDAINAITVPKINVEVELLGISIGSWTEQIMLMIAGGEKLDAFVTIPGGPAHFNSMVANKQLMPLNDLLDQYGKETKEVVGETLLSGTTVNGNIYAITSLFNKVSSTYIAMRTDLLEKYNLDASNIKTVADLEAIFKTIKDNEPTLTPLVGSSEGNVANLPGLYIKDTLADSELFDVVGDGTNMLGIVKFDEAGKIISQYETPEYLESVTRVHSWYEQGFVYQDSATTKETAQELVKGGKAFGYFFQGEEGAKVQQDAQTGYDMTVVEIMKNPVTTDMILKFTWGIPVTSTNAEAAMKFLNLTYTDSEVLNLIDWGIEGKHYVQKEDGTIGYPEGVTRETTGYGINADFMFGNQYLSKVWEGNTADLRDRVKKINEDAVKSPLIGFSFDSTGVQNELTALVNVIAEYRPGLNSGMLNPEDSYQEFIDSLKAAGLDDYLAEMQRQLDAWK